LAFVDNQIILFFLRALVSWWQDEKSFAIKTQIPELRYLRKVNILHYYSIGKSVYMENSSKYNRL